MSHKSTLLQMHRHVLYHLLQNNGPQLHDYKQIDDWILAILEQYQDGRLHQVDIQTLRLELLEQLSPYSLLSWIYEKPLGYAGDFWLLDCFYLNLVSPKPALKQWDLFVQNQWLPHLIRYRSVYFRHLLKYFSSQTDRPLRVLQLAGGPGRLLYRYLSNEQKAGLEADFVEPNRQALKYAKRLLAPYQEVIRFSALQPECFLGNQKYDLIWCGGLLDQQTDPNAAYLLRHAWQQLQVDGVLVIDGLHPNMPNHAFFELFADWQLAYRTEEDLRRLIRHAKLELVEELEVTRLPGETMSLMQLRKAIA